MCGLPWPPPGCPIYANSLSKVAPGKTAAYLMLAEIENSLGTGRSRGDGPGTFWQVADGFAPEYAGSVGGSGENPWHLSSISILREWHVDTQPPVCYHAMHVV